MLDTRELDEEDFPQFVALSHVMQEECEPNIPFDEHELLVNMFRCINDKSRTGFNIWVCYRGKQLIGMALASAIPFYFSRVLGVVLHYWYVLPKYRGTRAASELLRSAEKWARNLGAVRLYAGAERINDVEMADRVNKMIEKRGFTRFGHQYYKALGYGSDGSRSTT
jgi:GNAT superfamily N-acetyltransferase